MNAAQDWLGSRVPQRCSTVEAERGIQQYPSVQRGDMWSLLTHARTRTVKHCPAKSHTALV